MKDFENFHDKYVIFGGDFNIVFEKNLESAGGTFLKKHSLPLSFKLNKTFNLCDIWRVRNPHKNLLTLQQKHLTGIIQHRLDYLFVSNTLQESVEKKKNLNALSSSHSPVFCSFVDSDTFVHGSGVWKFNNSLLFNTDFL